MISVESRKCRLEAERVADEQQRRALAAPDRGRQRGQQQALGVREDLERARDRPHLLVEALEAPAPAQREVAGERDPARHERDRSHRGGPLAGGGVRDAGPREHGEQRREHGGVEDALGEDRAEDRAPLGGRARAEDRDPQHLAAARGQHVVAHVADERQPVGVGALVRDLGQAHDPVPAPAAGGERERVDPERGDQPAGSRRRSRGTSARPAARPTTRRRRARPPRRRSRGGAGPAGSACASAVGAASAQAPAHRPLVHGGRGPAPPASRGARARPRRRGGSRRGSGGTRGTRRAR